MLTNWYSLLVSAPSSRPSDQVNKCSVKACIFPRCGGEAECLYHIRFFKYPMSLLGSAIARYELYKRDKEDPRWWPILSVQPRREVFCKPRLITVRNGIIQKPVDPLRNTAEWGLLEMQRRILRAEDAARPIPGKPNRLTTASVIKSDGEIVATVSPTQYERPVNHQSTGAFVLYKGFGKKKIRKVQRRRPQGWHGNHPEQKPHDKWGDRETLNDIDLHCNQRVLQLLSEIKTAERRP